MPNVALFATCIRLSRIAVLVAATCSADGVGGTGAAKDLPPSVVTHPCCGCGLMLVTSIRFAANAAVKRCATGISSPFLKFPHGLKPKIDLFVGSPKLRQLPHTE